METPPTQDSQRHKPSGPLARGLSGTLKVSKPAHAVLNTAVWQGGPRPPSNPQPVAPLREQRARAGAAPEPRRLAGEGGCGGCLSLRPAAGGDGADAGVDRAGTGH